MKIAVIGSNGQLGQDVVAVLAEHGYDVSRLTHQDIEIRDPTSVYAALKSTQPDVVVNTAAMLQVDLAEDKPDLAFAVNALGVRNISLAAREMGFTHVEISTDYVFDGEKRAPYVETDRPRPLNVYANSKLAGEYFVREFAPKHFILRISGIYGQAPCRAKQGENFVTTMLRLSRERDELHVVDDEILSPTYARDIAEQLPALLPTNAHGLYHVTAAGQCSWFEFAAKIFEIADIATPLYPTTRDKFPKKAVRPAYSVLENSGLQKLGIDRMAHWADGLTRYLKRIL